MSAEEVTRKKRAAEKAKAEAKRKREAEKAKAEAEKNMRQPCAECRKCEGCSAKLQKAWDEINAAQADLNDTRIALEQERRRVVTHRKQNLAIIANANTIIAKARRERKKAEKEGEGKGA